MSASHRQKSLYTKLVWVFIAIAAVGVAILFYESMIGQSNTVLFSLVVFVISIAALIMTTLQGISADRQLRLIETIMRDTRESSHNMEQLVEEDRKLGRDIRKDMILDQEVVSILEQYGVGDNAEVRHEVASKIASKTELKS